MDTLWLDLLNSDWHDYLGRGQDEDRLDSTDWLRGFLARWDLAPADINSSDTRTALRGLRSLLQRFLVTLAAGEQPRPAELAALNAYLAAGPVVRRVDREDDAYHLRLVPVEGTLGAVLCETATSFAEVLVDGDPSRIKTCQNPDCKWVFYDRSRNRTRRWCAGPTACGNLLKVRRFRERKKKAAAKPSTKPRKPAPR